MTEQPIDTTSDSTAPKTASHETRRWFRKFHVAFRGLKYGIRGQSSFFVHFFFVALVIVAAIVLRCDWLQWCLLSLCIGMVLTAELINGAIETLFQGLDENTQRRTWKCLDIAAGAVLVAAVTAVIVGSIVFLQQLGVLIGW